MSAIEGMVALDRKAMPNGRREMSGGHWDYSHRRIVDDVFDIAHDESVRSRWPLVGEAMEAVARFVGTTAHDMDWDLSGDTIIEDDGAFDRNSFAALLDEILKAAPDEWFPRGKWATIQAIQGRTSEAP